MGRPGGALLSRGSAHARGGSVWLPRRPAAQARTQAAGEAASTVVRSVSHVGGDVGGAAVSAVEGAIKAAGDIGGDTGSLAKGAVLGAVKAADEISSDVRSLVRKALLIAVAAAHDIIDALLTGKTE